MQEKFKERVEEVIKEKEEKLDTSP